MRQVGAGADPIEMGWLDRAKVTAPGAVAEVEDAIFRVGDAGGDLVGALVGVVVVFEDAVDPFIIGYGCIGIVFGRVGNFIISQSGYDRTE